MRVLGTALTAWGDYGVAQHPKAWAPSVAGCSLLSGGTEFSENQHHPLRNPFGFHSPVPLPGQGLLSPESSLPTVCPGFQTFPKLCSHVPPPRHLPLPLCHAVSHGLLQDLGVPSPRVLPGPSLPSEREGGRLSPLPGSPCGVHEKVLGEEHTGTRVEEAESQANSTTGWERWDIQRRS